MRTSRPIFKAVVLFETAETDLVKLVRKLEKALSQTFSQLTAAFNPSNGWNVVAIEADRVQTNYHDDGAPAWLATIKRIKN